MDSDDDYQVLSPPELLPEVQFRRLKRSKKSGSKPSQDPSPGLVDDPVIFTSVGKGEALVNDSKTSAFGESNATEESILSQEQLSDVIFMEDDDRLKCGSDEWDESSKQVLDFDGDVTGAVVVQDSKGLEREKDEKHAIGEEALFSGKEGKEEEKVKSDVGGELNTDLPGSSKWREKERKAYLKELHAESQRLLRESRDASFKPTPVVQKPISTILEKLRKRKLEISKRFYVDRGNCRPANELMEIDDAAKGKERENVAAIVEKEIFVCVDGRTNFAASSSSSRECSDTTKQPSNENDQNKMCEDPTTFRAPLHDTQDLFDNSEPNGSAMELTEEEPVVPSREDFAPSLLTMDLKLDSALTDDSSSEEECNDKENIDPHPLGLANDSLSPARDPVKDFIDEEAEEEDDSDNDLGFSQANEDQDGENLEEFNDIIATDFEERPVDNERRNELHQKWLEQQDAAGTDNLMQRLRYGCIRGDTFLPDKEPGTDEDEEDFDGEAKEEYLPHKPARVSTKKAKELILQLLPDKEDAYLSDNDDNTQMKHAKQLFIRKEEKSVLVSPADDESSKEVFGLIKKLNIVPDNKRKPKELSFFDTVLKGRNINNSSKSSFLGRVSNHPISSKQRSGTARSFIFGRDDSNSRSLMSMAEESSDTVTLETRPTRLTAKCSSNSQTNYNSDAGDAVAEKASRTSLLEVLKQSSLQSNFCNKDSTVDLTKSIFSFRVSKKPIKGEQIR